MWPPKIHYWITHIVGVYSPAQHLLGGCDCQAKYFTEWQGDSLEMARSFEADENHD